MFFLMISMGACAESETVSTSPIHHVSISVDLFMSSTCSHCKKADLFFRELEGQNPWLSVKRYYIDKDTTALQLFYQRLREQNTSNFSVPAMFFCGGYWTGFDDPITTGKSLVKALDYCYQQVAQQGVLTPASIHLLQKWGMASQYQINPNEAPAPLTLIPMLALSDALGPCSLFGFMAFLAFLWLYPNHRWMQFALGLVLITGIGLTHYLQYAEAALYYHWTPKLKIATLIVGILLSLSIMRDFQSPRKGPVLRPGAFIFGVIMATILAVQIGQQTCQFNISFIFEQWLINQSLSEGRHFAYQLYYLMVYLLPLMLVLLFYLLLGQSPRIVASQKMLQKAAYVMLISLAILLVVYPAWLGDLTVSIVVFFLSLVIGWFLTRNKSKN
jgi:hypothetical protein